MRKGARKNLKNLRQKRGFTQTQIASQIGICVRQYKSLEAGTTEGSIKVWKELKSLLKAKTIDFLLEQEEEKREEVKEMRKWKKK